MRQKLLITLVLTGMLFFWGCGGGGKSKSSEDPGEDSQTVTPDTSGDVEDILPSPNKHVLLSHGDLTLYVGEYFDVTIVENKDDLDLTISSLDDVAGADDDFVACAEINGDIVTVRATGEGDSCIYLNYIGEDGNFRIAGHIDVTVNKRGPEFYPLVSSINYTDQSIGKMVVDGNYVYILDNGDSPGNKMHIIDISDVTNPVLVNYFTLDPGLKVYDMEASDGFLYVCAIVPDAYYEDARCGARIIDVRDPNSPVFVSEYLIQDVPFYEGWYYVIWLRYQNNKLYLHSQKGVEVLDVSNPSNPNTIGYFTHECVLSRECDFRDFAVSGNYIYITRYVGPWEGNPHKGVLTILDATDPDNIVMAGSIEIHPFRTYSSVATDNIYIAGKYAYIYDGPLSIIDIEDPYNPAVVPQTKTFQYDSFGAEDMFYENGFIFTNGIAILDVTDIEKPPLVSIGNNGRRYKRVELYGDYLLAGGVKTFSIYDISFFTNYSH
ncbi:MAG: hypothetical protein KJ737_04380 [Proteobacteria bacterium]|nr:hypothetical protein [Pseudomonadota bacterium]